MEGKPDGSKAYCMFGSFVACPDVEHENVITTKVAKMSFLTVSIAINASERWSSPAAAQPSVGVTLATVTQQET